MGGTKGQANSSTEQQASCFTVTPARPSLWVHTRRVQQLADTNPLTQKSMTWGASKQNAQGGTGLLSSRPSLDSPTSSAAGGVQQSSGSGSSPTTSNGLPARSLLATPPTRSTRPASPQPKSTSIRRVPSSSSPQVTRSMGFTTQQLQRQAPQPPASPLTVTSAPRMLRTSNLEGLPPQSPSKPLAQRFSRAPSTSVDNSTAATVPVNSALLAVHDSSRTDRAASMPATPATSSRRSSALAFSTPRTSITTASSSATNPPAGEVAGGNPAHNTTHTTTAWAVPASLARARSGASPTQQTDASVSASDWTADVSEAEVGPRRGSGSSRASGSSACVQLAPPAVAVGPVPSQQQQQQALERRRHSGGGYGPRAAWEGGSLSGSFAGVGSPKVGLSSAGAMRTPFSSLSLRARESGSLSGSFAVGSPKGVANGGSSSGTPTAAGFEASGTGTLTCLQPSKYASSFSHAFAAEQPTESEAGFCNSPSSKHTSAAACNGGSGSNAHSGNTHSFLGAVEDAHVGSFSMPPSMLRPASPGASKLSGARRSQEQPMGSNTAIISNTTMGSNAPISTNTAISSNASLLSGNAASAQRALRGPSAPAPSAPATQPMAVRAAVVAGASPTGEGDEARGDGAGSSPAARSPFMYYGRVSSGGNVDSFSLQRGPSMLRHSSMDPEERRSPATRDYTGGTPFMLQQSGDGGGSPRPTLHGKVLSAPVASATPTQNTLSSTAISSTCLSQQQQQERGTTTAQQQLLLLQQQEQAVRPPQAAKPSMIIAAAAAAPGATTAATAAAAPAATTAAATAAAAAGAAAEGKQQAHAPRTATAPATAPASTAAAAKHAGTALAPCVPAEPPTADPPALPPFGIPPADYAALLGGVISEEHSAALPGYTVGRVIGEGGFCQVRLGVHHLSKRTVAIKVIDKSKLTDVNEAKRIQREIRVMLHLTHECVIKLFEVVDSPAALYLIMEHAPNQSLLDYVRSRKRLAEGKAALILQQIVAGLQYCHRREVVHRDVKLENILLGADGNMKLIDFGLSAFFVPGKRLRVHCGSPSYAAPEIVSRKHYDGPPVDVWSLGVVLFACLAGHLPFHSSSGNKQELCQKIINGQFNMPAYLSPAAKDLLSRMLQVDPEQRATFEEVQAHPWVQAIAAWVPHGGSVYAFTGTLNEAVTAELEAVGYTRQQLLQTLQARVPCYLTTSYFLLCEAKVEQGRAAEQAARQQRAQRQQLVQQEAAAAPVGLNPVKVAGSVGVGWAETGAGSGRCAVACGH